MNFIISLLLRIDYWLVNQLRDCPEHDHSDLVKKYNEVARKHGGRLV